MVKTIVGLVVGLVAFTALVYGVQMPDFRAEQVDLLYRLTGGVPDRCRLVLSPG